MMRIADGEIHEWYVFLREAQQGETCLCLKILQPRSFMRKTRKMKLFMLLLRDYWERHLDFLSYNQATRSMVTPSSDFLTFRVQFLPENINLAEIVDALEKDIIQEALRRAEGIKISAAKHLGITERIMGYKIKKYGL